MGVRTRTISIFRIEQLQGPAVLSLTSKRRRDLRGSRRMLTGKLRFLISVKNPLPIRPAETARKRGPCRAPPVARFAPPVGLRPPFVTHPATFLILIDALF